MKRSAFAVAIAPLEESNTALDVDFPPSELELDASGFAFEGRLKGRLVYMMTGHDVFVRGHLETSVGAGCVRCLDPVPVTIRTDVELAFVPGAGQDLSPLDEELEDPIFESYSGDFLDPGEQLRDLMLLDLPDRPLCDPECKGLCPGCGANRNRQSCSCRTDESSATVPRDSENWKEALRKLKID